MILLIDNYDSFTYNLYQYLGELGNRIVVHRNDKITPDEVQELSPDQIVLSPGPGRPSDAGICIDLVRRFSGQIPILGICLGHQSIGEAFGGNIIHAPELFHGKTSEIQHNNKGIYQGLPPSLKVGRYHSLIVERNSLPDCFQVTCWTEDDLIMGMEHKTHKTQGIQFHPESILTPEGKTILAHFIDQHQR